MLGLFPQSAHRLIIQTSGLQDSLSVFGEVRIIEGVLYKQFTLTRLSVVCF